MTSAPKHLPLRIQCFNKFIPAVARGWERIALFTAGDIITFIARGTADLFSVPLTAQRSTTPTFSERPGADGLETLSFLLLITVFFQGQTLEMLGYKAVL